jgi:hypothetical protein
VYQNLGVASCRRCGVASQNYPGKLPNLGKGQDNLVHSATLKRVRLEFMAIELEEQVSIVHPHVQHAGYKSCTGIHRSETPSTSPQSNHGNHSASRANFLFFPVFILVSGCFLAICGISAVSTLNLFFGLGYSKYFLV